MKIAVTEHDIATLAEFPTSGYGIVFLGLLQKEIDEDEENLDQHPMICDENINNDWRTKRGEIRGLKRALDLASKYTNQQI